MGMRKQWKNTGKKSMKGYKNNGKSYLKQKKKKNGE